MEEGSGRAEGSRDRAQRETFGDPGIVERAAEEGEAEMEEDFRCFLRNDDGVMPLTEIDNCTARGRDKRRVRERE